MHFDYYKGCQITLRAGTAAKDLLECVAKRIRKDYPGAEIVVEDGATSPELEILGVMVPHGHPLEGMGEVDQKGKLIRPMGGELILRSVTEIIREEEKT